MAVAPISEVRSTLSNENVVALMDTIIDNNVFLTTNGKLISKYSAQIVQRDVTKLEV